MVFWRFWGRFLGFRDPETPKYFRSRLRRSQFASQYTLAWEAPKNNSFVSPREWRYELFWSFSPTVFDSYKSCLGQDTNSNYMSFCSRRKSKSVQYENAQNDSSSTPI